jgi:dolichyldiphosphatase
MQNIRKVMDYIGTTGPYLLNIISIGLLIDKQIYLFFYILGYIINIIINLVLKNIIKDPRPDQDTILFELGLKHGKRFTMDKYGMPSGHVQGVAFSLMFVYLVLNNIYVLWFYLFVVVLTMMQRYNYNNHTLSQIIIGLLVGLSVGYLFYYLSHLFIKGKLLNKKDDNCIIY